MRRFLKLLASEKNSELTSSLWMYITFSWDFEDSEHVTTHQVVLKGTPLITTWTITAAEKSLARKTKKRERKEGKEEEKWKQPWNSALSPLFTLPFSEILTGYSQFRALGFFPWQTQQTSSWRSSRSSKQGTRTSKRRCRSCCSPMRDVVISAPSLFHLTVGS